MNFGISYIGLIITAMLIIPNLIWLRYKPDGYDEYSKKENKILALFEMFGEVMVIGFILIFKECNIRPHSLWIGWLILTFIFMGLYEIYWIRYFRSEKKMEDMYRSFVGFSVAGASLPVLAELSLGIYASNIFIIFGAVILGIGHIGIHLAHKHELMGNVKSGRKAARVIKIVFLVPVCLFVILIIGIIAVRNYNDGVCYIDTDKGIDESEYLEINGQEQFVTIRGRDSSNPIIVYLHGGPGSPDSVMTYTFTNKLIDDYTVVCWDQRGCGRTYVRNKNIDKENESVTFDQALKDLDILIEYLKGRFGDEKVIVMGHSYGSVLGSTYAYEHPEKVEAYIGIGQFVSFESSSKYEYNDAIEKAKEAGDDTAELTEAYENYLREKTVDAAEDISKYAAPYHNAPREKSTILAALVSPTLSSEDLLWYKNVTSYEKFWKYTGSLMNYLMAVNLRESQIHYDVPVLFISGECDWNCAAPDMVDYAQMIGARYELIDGCGHYVQNDDPEEFARLVKEFLQTSEIDDKVSVVEESTTEVPQDSAETDAELIEDTNLDSEEDKKESTDAEADEESDHEINENTSSGTEENSEATSNNGVKFEMVRGGYYIIPEEFENITKEIYALKYVQEWQNQDLDMYIRITDAMQMDIPIGIDEEYSDLIDGFSDPSALPLNVKQEDGYAISSIDDEGQISYQKVRAFNERYVGIYITYPSSNSETCNKIVEDFISNFVYE